MPNAPAATLLAEAYTWYSTGLRDLVLELLDEAGLDTASDTIDDLCGDLWLHAAELAASAGLSYTGLLDALDAHATTLVTGLRHREPVTAAGRLDTAELAVTAADRAGHQPLPRPHRHAAEYTYPRRAAA
ncbi:hypothetical protein [Kitasatospora sp. NPDC001547]|uniref:hypothetical protein n=1 Tax=Kitasatospora sp. NPDC001547 TaxID=3364015 RepID=UPI0036AE6AFA